MTEGLLDVVILRKRAENFDLVTLDVPRLRHTGHPVTPRQIGKLGRFDRVCGDVRDSRKPSRAPGSRPGDNAVNSGWLNTWIVTGLVVTGHHARAIFRGDASIRDPPTSRMA